MPDNRFPKELLKPRHWLTWLAFGAWYLLAQAPYKAQWWLANALAPLLKLNKKRLRYARRNIELCFPEKSPAEREALLQDNMVSTAMTVFETGIAWFWPKWRFKRLYKVRGLEHLDNARAQGQGALMLSLHFTTLEIGTALLGQEADFDGMYRPHGNPVYDYVQRQRRQRHTKDAIAIPREGVRTMISRLRKKHFIWYAPDRDLGDQNSLFVPFFGVPAATVSATGKLVSMGRARVIPFSQYRLPGGKGYELVVHPPFEDFPTGDDYADTLRVSQFMEEEVRKCPEQYFWAQPRFKTRPDGEPSLYQKRP